MHFFRKVPSLGEPVLLPDEEIKLILEKYLKPMVRNESIKETMGATISNRRN